MDTPFVDTPFGPPRDSKGGENPHWDSPRDGDSKARDSEVRDSENRDSEARDSESGQIHGPLNSDTLALPLIKFRSLGTTPTSGKKLSEWKGDSRSSGSVPGYSRSSSRSSENNFWNAKSHCRNGVSRLVQCETTILGGSPGIDGNPHERFHFAHAFLERFLKNWGGPARQKKNTL